MGKTSVQWLSLDFREFLVEMETTAEEKDRLRTIIQKLIDGDAAWIEQNGIVAGNKGDHWMLNYNQFADKNPYNGLVRGMVVQKPTNGFHGDVLSLIRSFPFTRFFNRHEPQAHAVDFSNAEMLEKLDGTMVGIYFPTGDPKNPEWHTRKMSSRSERDMSMKIRAFHGEEFGLLPLIGKYVKAIPWGAEDVGNTYVMEFIHDATMVITRYAAKDHGLHLLGARNVRTHRELNEQELDAVAARLGIRRPRRWDAVADEDAIAKVMADMAGKGNNFEGFVFRDKKTGNRVKLKDSEYVKLHHMLDKLTYRKLVQSVLSGETDEILAYFPHAKDKIEKIMRKHKDYIEHVIQRIRYWQDRKLDRKDLAGAMLGRPAKRFDSKTQGPTPKIPPQETDGFVIKMVFKLIGEQDENKMRAEIDSELRRVAMGKDAFTVGQPADYLRIIGLDEEDDSNDTTQEL